MATTIGEYHESLKKSFQDSRRSSQSFSSNSPAPLNDNLFDVGRKLINFAIKETAKIMGYTDERLRNEGKTATLVVYSKISQIDRLLQTVL